MTIIGIVSAETSSLQDSNSRKFFYDTCGTMHLFYKTGTPDNIWHAQSYDHGVTWNFEQITDEASNQDYVTACPDRKNNIHVAWSGVDDAISATKMQLRYMKYDYAAGTWGAIETLTSTTVDDYYQASIDVDSENNPHIVVRIIPASGTQQLYHIYKNGAVWTTIHVIQPTEGNRTTPNLAIDGNDNLHVLFCGLRTGVVNNQLQYIRGVFNSSRTSVTFGSLVTLTTKDNDYVQQWNSLAVDGGNKLHAVWDGRWTASGVGTKYQIRYSTSSNHGITWSSATLTTDNLNDQDLPTVMCGNDDVVHVFWRGWREWGDKDIRHIAATGGVWGSKTTITSGVVAYGLATLNTYEPVVYNINTNMVRTGSVVVYANSAQLTLYKSTDFTPIVSICSNCAGMTVETSSGLWCMNSPDIMECADSRNMSMYNLWTDARVVTDMGEESDTLHLSGTETQKQRIDWLWDAIDAGDSLTIDGVHSLVDDEYYAKDFSYSVSADTYGAYRWDLTLRRIT